MTTIAYDGVSLASDSQVGGAYLDGGIKKVVKIGKSYFGAAGHLESMTLFFKWLREGGDKPKIDSDSFEGIEVRGKSVYWWGDALTPCRIRAPAAIGSGVQFAMGAMLAGATAKEAVKIAAKLDGGTGRTIKSVKIV